MSERRRRILVIGAGEIARRVHLPYLRARPDRPEIIVHDIDDDAAAQTAEPFGARVLRGDYASCGADTAVVCTPPSTHAKLVIAALQAGMHVICEKPLADSAADAAWIERESRLQGRRVFACYTNRYRPDVRALAHLIGEGRLGVIQHAAAHWIRRDGIPGTDGGLSSGVLWDLGSHLVDLGLLLAGWRGSVTAFAVSEPPAERLGEGTDRPGWYGRRTSMSSEPAEESISGLAKFDEGVLRLLASWNYRSPQDEVLIQIRGSRGLAELRTVFGFSPDRRRVKGPALRVCASGHDGWIDLVPQQSREPEEYREQLDAAYAIAEMPGASARADLSLAVRSVTLCHAFADSMTTRSSVTTFLT